MSAPLKLTSKTAIMRHARESIGGLGDPSKMPGLAYGLPAEFCITGSKLAKIPGTPCFTCYAKKGRYACKAADGISPGTVEIAQKNRFRTLADLDSWRDSFIRIFHALEPITAETDRFFRWHDSGDVQSVQHLAAIVAIAEACPGWSFWIPTQEHGILRQYIQAGGTIPSNLVIRQSSPKLDTPMPGTLTGCQSYVHTDESVRRTLPGACPAAWQGNKCGDCRLCWSSTVPVVIYKLH